MTTAAKLFLPASLLASVLLTGCGLQGGTTVVKHEKGTEARTTEVTQSGDYALYDSYDATPQITVPLDKGDTIGFRKNDNSGKVVAVAGSREYQIDQGDKTYYWKRK